MARRRCERAWATCCCRRRFRLPACSSTSRRAPGAIASAWATVQETHVGVNTGGGVKVSLLGPVRARLDYRLFKLRGDPLHSTVHRVYAGLNLAF